MGKLANIKTKPTKASVDDFIKAITDEKKRNDSLVILSLMKKLSGEAPSIWGSSIIGFGEHLYKSPATGREVQWFKIGFSPRKANLSLYLILDRKKYADLFKKLGKHKTGVGCLYINKLDDIDLKTLEKLIAAALK